MIERFAQGAGLLNADCSHQSASTDRDRRPRVGFRRVWPSWASGTIPSTPRWPSCGERASTGTSATDRPRFEPTRSDVLMFVLVRDTGDPGVPVPWLSGRASASHAEGRWFEPSRDHQTKLISGGCERSSTFSEHANPCAPRPKADTDVPAQPSPAEQEHPTPDVPSTTAGRCERGRRSGGQHRRHVARHATGDPDPRERHVAVAGGGYSLSQTACALGHSRAVPIALLDSLAQPPD